MSLKLDEVDREIIERLREDARMTFVDIGKALDVSDATVYNRVKRLHACTIYVTKNRVDLMLAYPIISIRVPRKALQKLTVS